MYSQSISNRQEIVYCASHPWRRWLSITTLAFSIGLLGICLFGYSYYTSFAAALIPLLLIVLSFALFLILYLAWHLRREHRQSDQTFRY